MNATCFLSKYKSASACVALAVSAFQVGPALSAATAAEADAGFVSLFDGATLNGWDGNPKLWSVKDGVIHGQTTADNSLKGNTFLIWTNGRVSDFELRCSYRIVPNNKTGFANSGIQYRSKVVDPAGWVVGGYQADMEAGPTYSGILYEEKMQRSIMAARGEKVTWTADCKKEVTGSLGKSEDIQAGIKKEDWNDYIIIAKGNHLQHFINGKPTVDVTDECAAQRASSGVLALQIHAGEPMTVEFRNLRFKNLSDAKPNGDLARMQGVWRVTSIQTNGEQAPDDVTNLVVTIKGDKYHLEGNGADDQGKLTVDSEPRPHQMDAESDGGAQLAGIYELDGDKMKICYAPKGRGRPDAFTTAQEDRRVLVTYKKQ